VPPLSAGCRQAPTLDGGSASGDGEPATIEAPIG
jgi:hypothetical protein